MINSWWNFWSILFYHFFFSNTKIGPLICSGNDLCSSNVTLLCLSKYGFHDYLIWLSDGKHQLPVWLLTLWGLGHSFSFLSKLSMFTSCLYSLVWIHPCTHYPSVSLHISPSLSFSFKQSLFWVYWPHLSRSKNTFSLFVTFFFFTSSAFFGRITLMFSSILFLPLLVLMLANCPLFNRHQHFFQARRVERVATDNL